MADIAIIGWGSLIWDLDDLGPKVRGPWRMGDGPKLPLEFSRVSAKRLGALAVVIDSVHGVPCPSHAILSVRSDVTAAREDLAARERAPLERIGAVSIEHPAGGGAPTTPVAELIRAWCRYRGLAGAVWTDLEANFAPQTGRPFSVPNAIAYLRALEGPSGAEATRYIQEAPATTDTPLRRALAAEPWWQDRAAALS